LVEVNVEYLEERRTGFGEGSAVGSGPCFPKALHGVLGSFDARRHGDVLGVHPGEELAVFRSPLTKQWVQEFVLTAVVSVQEPEKLVEVVRKA
jgi:hypothetical protein